MDIDDQSANLEQSFIMTNLKIYLDQPLYNANKDGFIKICDFKQALISLKCDSVSNDDIESLVSVIVQMIFEDRVDQLSGYSKLNELDG
jgi:hypothetical protein